MNFGKYHVSRNLINIRDFTATTTPTSQDGVLWTGTLAEGTYTFSINQDDTLTSSLRNTIHIKIGSTNYYENSSGNYHNNSGRHSYTFTVPDATTMVEIRYWTNAISNDCSFSQGMLNSGSTALPYEPYSSEVWHDIPHYVHKTDTDTITTLPAVLYPTGTTATVGLKGQTVQSSTPSPDSPVMPQGCGERTGNLYPLDASKLYVGRIENDGTIDYEIGTITVGVNSVTYEANATWRGFYTDFIQVNENEKLTFSPNDSSAISWACCCYDENDNFLGKASSQSTASIRIFTLLTGTKKVRMSVTGFNTTYTILRPMLNTGSTALPYEPYGYKIPISSANTTTSVYLGEVETTRRIQKVVFTGSADETWNGDSLDNKMRYYPTPMITNGVPLTEAISTHFAFGGFNANSGANGTITGTNSSSAYRMYFWSSDYATVDAWKSYLAQQYAAGTPVTVWYVLATEETGIVNEPLMKIDTYADEVSNVSIPVTAGGDTLSVDTTVQPSEVTVAFHGWHPVADVHEKSKNLFDKSTAVDGYGVDNNSGNLFRSAALSASDYINISSESYIRATYITSGVANQYGAFYDENKTYISGYSGYSNAIAVPQNAVYTRITARTEYIDEFMLNVGSSALPYEPYWT